MFSLLVGAFLAKTAMAQSDESDIAKQTQNPGAVLVSFPFQFNFNGNIGPYHRTQTLLNIQPVLPVPFSKKCAHYSLDHTGSLSAGANEFNFQHIGNWRFESPAFSCCQS